MAKQTITAFYDSRELANNAALELQQVGIATTDITVSPETAGAGYADTAHESKGFWASLEDMFGGSDDHSTYAEGLRRGGTMLTAHVDDARIEDVITVLEQHGSVDLGERETAWRNEGWSGSSLSGSETSALGVGSTGALTEATARASTTIGRTNVTPPQSVPAVARTGRDDTIEVVEESLNVGKRAVNRGKVRIHSYVVEKAVSENVTLRDETISIDRRPVDRALSANVTAEAFAERTIEMEEVDQEAVISKTAHVVEEIGIRKTATDRVETVNDTVRSTKVDIEDTRTAGNSKIGLTGDYATLVKNDMEVVGSDGQHVGTVDHLDRTSIKLKKMDSVAGGQHHLIPLDWVSSVTTKVMLKTTAAEAKVRWTAA